MRKTAALLVVLGLFALAAVWVHISWRAPLPQIPLIIETVNGPVRFTVEVATTRPQMERGLMYRKSLAPNTGMLFEFDAEKHVAFWMKDTLIPLDMIFIGANGTIILIAPNRKPLSLELVGPAEPVRAVLEIRGGQASELALRPGDLVVNSIFGNASR